ncbi:helix-turn-helix transcriptional regulator [Microbacterium maritypicum]|uniref:helix-turn-helix domain-containing protein n=1 Tax=Microbacterium maritypicum TaxID=33918 RepID=UPI003ED06DD8
MASDNDRKELPLTRFAIERATQQERLSYGALLARLRDEKGVTQGELEERSGVTSRTIRNIENGTVAGQTDKLIRLFIALGADLDGDAREEVESYIAMIAPMLRAIHPDHRFAAVTQLVPILSDAVRANPNSEIAKAPISIGGNRRARVGGRRQNLESVDLSTMPVAASTDNTPINPDRGEA